MIIISNRNVNRNFPVVMTTLETYGERRDSRNGPVLVMPYPVTTVTKRPTERVLFSAARRANPFFHLFEAMWMLAGERNALFLDQFVHDFTARYAEPGGDMHGAYGWRWRQAHGVDQIRAAIDSLKVDPNTRRCVITMWDPKLDVWNAASKDLPCNTHIYLRRRGAALDVLDMTVCCRSNDAVWGLCGANVVHFSVLQEYVAAHLQCHVGSLTQISNDLHVYDASAHLFNKSEADCDLYSKQEVTSLSLFGDFTKREVDDQTFVWLLRRWLEEPTKIVATSPLFVTLARIARAHVDRRDPENAVKHLEPVQHRDWARAAEQWLTTQKKRSATA